MASKNKKKLIRSALQLSVISKQELIQRSVEYEDYHRLWPQDIDSLTMKQRINIKKLHHQAKEMSKNIKRFNIPTNCQVVHGKHSAKGQEKEFMKDFKTFEMCTDEKSLKSNYFYQMSRRNPYKVQMEIKMWITIIVDVNGFVAEKHFWSLHTMEYFTGIYAEIPRSPVDLEVIETYRNFLEEALEECKDEKELQNDQIYKEMKEVKDIFDIPDLIKFMLKTGQNKFYDEQDFWHDALTGWKSKTEHEEQYMKKFRNVTQSDLSKSKRELDELKVIIDSAECEEDLILHPLYARDKEDVDSLQIGALLGIGQELVKRNFQNETIFWMESFLKRKSVNKSGDSDAYNAIIYMSVHSEDHYRVLKYGKLILHHFGTVEDVFQCSMFKDMASFYLTVAQAAEKLNQFDDAFDFHTKRWKFLIDKKIIKPQKPSKPYEEPGPYECLLNMAFSAYRRNKYQEVLEMTKIAPFATLNASENIHEFDHDSFLSVHTPVYAAIEDGEFPNFINILLSNPMNVELLKKQLVLDYYDLHSKLADICLIKALSMERLGMDWEQSKSLIIKSSEMFSKFLKHLEVIPYEDYLNAMACIFLRFNSKTNEPGKEPPKFDVIAKLNGKSDVYHFLKADQRYQIRKLILEYIKRVLNSNEEKTETKEQYLRFKNSIFINDYMKCYVV